MTAPRGLRGVTQVAKLSSCHARATRAFGLRPFAPAGALGACSGLPARIATCDDVAPGVCMELRFGRAELPSEEQPLLLILAAPITNHANEES